MTTLKIHPEKINETSAAELIQLCPFSAISYAAGTLEISAACRMCRLCVKKGPAGAITLEEVASPPSTLNKDEWRGIAVYVEHQAGCIHNVTLELIGKAKELAAVTGHPVYALLLGSQLDEMARQLLYYGVDTVYLCDKPQLAQYNLEPYANAFAAFIQQVKPSSVMVGATTIGRSLAPRVAARFRTGLTADCTVLEMKENTDLVQIRPAFGGNIMAQIITPGHRPQFCTVRYKIFPQPQPGQEATGSIKAIELLEEELETGVVIEKTENLPSEIDLSEAKIIVAVGRGVKDEQGMALARQLAEQLGAQLACTRPLIENGWFDAKRQIGLSGRTVNADLIITLGVSGSVQFAAGMQSSQCIIAVNSDAAAPIFEFAHYGIVGDLYEVISAMLANVPLQEGTVCTTK